MTWEYDEIVAGGQNDRYAMCRDIRAVRHADQRPETVEIRRQMGLGYGARPDREIAGAHLGGRPLPGDPKIYAEQGLVAGIHPDGLQQDWMRRSMVRGNAPPRGSVLRDPEMVALIGWPPVAAAAIETGFPTPAQPVFSTLQLSLRTGLSEAILGQKTPQQALDDVAKDWQRGMRRAGMKAG
jgi:multiple sugar transport system substrate-binding protein